MSDYSDQIADVKYWPVWLRRTFILTLPLSVPLWIFCCFIGGLADGATYTFAELSALWKRK